MAGLSSHGLFSRLKKRHTKDTRARPFDTIAYFKQLPPSVFDRVLDKLGEKNVKSFSLTCHDMLDRCEKVRQLAPRLRFTGILPGRHRNTCWVIPDLCPVLSVGPCPGSILLFDSPSTQDQPPTYTEVEPTWRESPRSPRCKVKYPFTKQIWICPHHGCTPSELHRLWSQGSRPHFTQNLDTIDTSCPFPKCALWARHGLTINFKHNHNPIYELRSCIKLFRYRCTDIMSAKNTLGTKVNLERLGRACKALKLPLCSHHSLGDVFKMYDWACTAIIDARNGYQPARALKDLKTTNSRWNCAECTRKDTYTEWDIIARFVSQENQNWLDVEVLVCRPVFDYAAVDTLYFKGGFEGPHWTQHAFFFPQYQAWVSWWWLWASIVAEGGFDWRARLPAQFLQHNNGNLLDFPRRHGLEKM